MKTCGLFVLGVALLCVSTNAAADTIDTMVVNYHGGSSSNDSYYAHFDSASGGAEKHWVAELDVTLTDSSLKLSSYQTYGYCVEISQSVSNKTYTTYEMLFLNTLNDDAYYKAAWLMDAYAQEDGLYISGVHDKYYKMTALQGLIWELVDGDDVGTASFTNNKVTNYYDTYKNALASVTFDSALKESLSSLYVVVHDSTYQDLMLRVENSGSEVPEPATLVLFGAGLFGFAYNRRRFTGKVRADN